MSRFILQLAIALSLLASGVMAVESKVAHPFLCADTRTGSVMKVDRHGQVVWSYSVPQVHDVWGLKNGNVLLASIKQGVQIVSPDKKVLWHYQPGKKQHSYSCQPLPNGDVLVGISGKPNRVVEVNREGLVTKTIEVNATGAIRLVRKTKSGNYVVAARSEKKVQVYDASGALIREVAVPGVYHAVELDNGNILVGCMDAHRVLEIDPNDTIVWQIDENELPGIPLRTVGGLQRLPNGNTVIINYAGADYIGQQPQIIEVTPDKEVVWQVFDNEQLCTPAHVQLLDIPGDAAAGELYR